MPVIVSVESGVMWGLLGKAANREEMGVLLARRWLEVPPGWAFFKSVNLKNLIGILQFWRTRSVT